MMSILNVLMSVRINSKPLMLMKFMLHIGREPQSRRWMRKNTNETENQVFDCMRVNLYINQLTYHFGQTKVSGAMNN
jgi:hypothetical protein